MEAPEEIARARRAAVWMRRLAWLNVVVGVLAIVVGIARLLTSADAPVVTVEYFLAVGLALTTSGIALVGASWNLRLSALRAQLQLQGSASAPDTP